MLVVENAADIKVAVALLRQSNGHGRFIGEADRTKDLAWFAAKFRAVYDGFVGESSNGVICSIPDEGLNTPPHRTWCARCKSRWIKFRSLVMLLESASQEDAVDPHLSTRGTDDRPRATESTTQATPEQPDLRAWLQNFHDEWKDRCERGGYTGSDAESMLSELAAALHGQRPSLDLLDALRKLMKESAAVLALSEEAIRESAGHTNLSVFKLRVQEAADVLKGREER